MTNLPSLLARVKEAYRPDRALFTDALEALGGVELRLGSPDWYDSFLRFLEAKAWENAALALCERVLPGWDWSVHGHTRDVPPQRHGWAGVRAPPKGIVSGTLYEANGYTPALALLAALLTAMEQKHD